MVRVKKASLAILLAILVLAVVGLTTIGTLSVKADTEAPLGQVFTGVAGSPDGKELYDATNTYGYNV